MSATLTTTHQPVLAAFLAGRAKTCDNTSTDGQTLCLYGHTIAYREGQDAVLVVPKAWNTPTTRRRLAALLHEAGIQAYGVGAHKGTPTCGGSYMAMNATGTAWIQRVRVPAWNHQASSIPSQPDQPCPFKVGDRVVRNGKDAVGGWHKEGEAGKVAEVKANDLLVVEYDDGQRTGYHRPGSPKAYSLRDTWDALDLEPAPVQAGPVVVEPKPQPVAPPFDALGQMIAWEQGDLDDEQTVELFQHLIDTGLAWNLQGCYGRQAAALIDAGYCHR